MKRIAESEVDRTIENESSVSESMTKFANVDELCMSLLFPLKRYFGLSELGMRGNQGPQSNMR